MRRLGLFCVLLVLCASLAWPNALDELGVNTWTTFSTNSPNDWVYGASGHCTLGTSGDGTCSGSSAGSNDFIVTWCDGEFNERYSTHGGLIVGWCGGHQAYEGNDLYAFDVEALTWAQINDPDPDVDFTEATDANCVIGNPCDSDNLIDHLGGAAGEPCAPHSYGLWAYSPVSNKMQLMNARCSLAPPGWDFATSSWYVATAQSSTPGAHSDVDAIYDIKRNDGVYFANNSGGKVAVYDFDTDTWSQPTGFLSYSQKPVAVYDAYHDIYVHLSFKSAGNYKLQVVDPNDSYAKTTITNINDTSYMEATDAYGGSVNYDPILNKLVFWPCPQETDAKDICTLTVPDAWSTAQWTWATIDITSGTAPDLVANGEYGKFRYVPSKNVYVGLTDITGPTHAIRLDSTPDAPQCYDGLDNDGDGYYDLADPQCTGPTDDAESGGQCDDGLDNDGDGDTDLADADCDDANDQNETQCYTDSEANCSCDVADRVLCYDFESTTDMIDGAAGHPDDTMGWGESSGARIIQNGGDFTNCSYESNSEHAGNECWRLDSTYTVTGTYSLEMEWRDLAIAAASPDFRIPFTDDGSITYGAGDTFEVAFAHRISPELVSANLLAQTATKTNWKISNLGRGDKWDAPTEAVSSCNTEEIVLNRDSRSPSWGGRVGGLGAYHSCAGCTGQSAFGAIADCNDGCQIAMQHTPGGEAKCYYNTGQYIGAPGFCGPDGNCLEFQAETWTAYKYKVTIAAWGSDAGNRIQVYAYRPGVDTDWLLIEDSGDTGCSTQSICHAAENEGYGKIWLTGYTTGRDYVTGDGDGSIWFDHLIVSKEDIAASEYGDPGTGDAVGSRVRGGSVSGGSVE